MHRLAGESEAGQLLESKALRDIHHPWVLKSTAPLEVLALEVLFLQVHRKTRRKRDIQVSITTAPDHLEAQPSCVLPPSKTTNADFNATSPKMEIPIPSLLWIPPKQVTPESSVGA